MASSPTPSPTRWSTRPMHRSATAGLSIPSISGLTAISAATTASRVAAAQPTPATTRWRYGRLSRRRPASSISSGIASTATYPAATEPSWPSMSMVWRSSVPRLPHSVSAKSTSSVATATSSSSRCSARFPGSTRMCLSTTPRSRLPTTSSPTMSYGRR